MKEIYCLFIKRKKFLMFCNKHRATSAAATPTAVRFASGAAFRPPSAALFARPSLFKNFFKILTFDVLSAILIIEGFSISSAFFIDAVSEMKI